MGSNWTLGRLARGCGVDSPGSGEGPLAGSQECGDEHLGSGTMELVNTDHFWCITNESKLSEGLRKLRSFFQLRKFHTIWKISNGIVWVRWLANCIHTGSYHSFTIHCKTVMLKLQSIYSFPTMNSYVWHTNTQSCIINHSNHINLDNSLTAKWWDRVWLRRGERYFTKSRLESGVSTHSSHIFWCFRLAGQAVQEPSPKNRSESLCKMSMCLY
jgi:hypothetical protein